MHIHTQYTVNHLSQTFYLEKSPPKKSRMSKSKKTHRSKSRSRGESLDFAEFSIMMLELQ